MTSDDEEFYARDFSAEDEKEFKITEDNVREFTKAFNDFDINGDGLLSASELGTIMRSVGHNPTAKELQDMIASADMDGNGFIDLPEFINMMVRRIDEDSSEQDLRNAFSLFDKDENGFINADELKFVLDGMGCTITEESIEDMIREADIDGDGCINFEGIGIAFSPLIVTSYFDDETTGFSFYGRSTVCLPFQLSSDQPAGWEYSVAIFMALNGLAFAFILVAYVAIFIKVQRSAKRVNSVREQSSLGIF